MLVSVAGMRVYDNDEIHEQSSSPIRWIIWYGADKQHAIIKF